MAEFEAKCLEVIEKVDETGEPVFITKDGVPIATLYSGSTQAEKYSRGDEPGELTRHDARR